MTVYELRLIYGKLKLEYYEHGPRQPVYPMEYLSGTLLGFSNWNMDDLLTSYMVPTDLIIKGDYKHAIHVIKIGSNIMECIIPIGIGLRNTSFSYNYVSHYIEDENIYVYVRLFKTDMYGDNDTIDYGEYVIRFRYENNTSEYIEVVSLSKK